MKRGKISRVEEYCASKMYEDGHTVQEIATFLDRSPKIVQQIIPKQRHKNVAVMTPAKSEQLDEKRAVSKPRKLPHVHRIHG